MDGQQEIQGNTLLSISEGKQVITKQAEYLLKIATCNRCAETLSPSQKFCGRCGLTTTLAEQYTKEMDLERENKELKILAEKQKEKESESTKYQELEKRYAQDIKKIREDMENKFQILISKIELTKLV
jgi:predicted ATP-dependent serine protease